ncbi:MAG TPA: cell division protein FtsA [Spirochaetales bacterium]|nr:cell division protein FtsA [Spirochaetales bacterium]
MVGLDVGTAKTCAVIGEFNENGVLEIIGVGAAPSTGLRRGVVVNIEATLKSVAQAVEAAELMSGREVRELRVGVSGANIEGINSRGVVAVTGKGREIGREDVARVIEAARAVAVPMDREILHVIPQSYIVDDQKGIRDPLDMIGVRLEAEVHIITGSVTTAQNLVRCVNRAGFKVDGLVLQSLAASRAVLSSDERELGCLVIDLGAGTTDILVWDDGAPYYTAVVPVGQAQVTNDLSIMLSVPMEAAERLKLESGSCWIRQVEMDETVIIPGLGGRPPQEVPRARVAAVIQPRMEEIFRLARRKVEERGFWNRVKGGVVLVGGGALMPGACELAQDLLGLSARVGFPVGSGGLVDEFRSPAYATAVGLVLLGAEAVPAEAREGREPERERRSPLSRLADWVRREFF